MLTDDGYADPDPEREGQDRYIAELEAEDVREWTVTWECVVEARDAGEALKLGREWLAGGERDASVDTLEG